MTGFNFKLVVSGLCAFVPDKDYMKIVLPNARDFDHKGKKITPGTPNTEIHVPVIAVPKPFVTNKGRRPGFQFRNLLISPHTLFAFPLDGDDLKVTPVAPDPVKGPAPMSKCPSKQTNTNYGWIARMVDVGSGTMLKKAKDDSLANNDLVLARLTFAAGKCATQSFALDYHKTSKAFHVVKWTYTDEGNKELPKYQRRALTEVIVADIPIASGNDVIIGEHANAIYVNNGGKNVHAFLLNLPLPDLLNEKLSAKARKREHHFEHFHRLAEPHLAAASMKMYAPAPRKTKCKKVISGLGGPKCPPAFFEL